MNEEIYYIANDDGTISSFAGYKYDENALQAEEKIVQGYDGRYYFESTCPTQPLEELKLAKRVEIKQSRDNAEQGGFEYMGKTFDSDPIACQRISCAAQAMSLSSGDTKITWTCQDNSTIELTAEQLAGLVGALAQHSNACHQKATKLKADVDKAKTAEEVEAIKWEN